MAVTWVNRQMQMMHALRNRDLLMGVTEMQNYESVGLLKDSIPTPNVAARYTVFKDINHLKF